MNRPKDEGLNGNEKIEQAVYALQQEATQEQKLGCIIRYAHIQRISIS